MRLRSGLMAVAVITIVTVVRSAVQPDQGCVVTPIADGYGANGPHAMVADSFENEQWPGAMVYVFRSQTSDTVRSPLILFCHGFGAGDPRIYDAFIRHAVSRGMAVVYSSYKSFAMDPIQRRKYRMIQSGFEQAVRRFSGVVDTARVGYVGHSYGGGAVPAAAWRGLVENRWGATAVFMFIMAPWYAYDIEQEQLENWPEHCKLLVQVYEGDFVNDHRMAVDLFSNIGIPGSEKDFVIVHGAKYHGCELSADHSVPTGPGDPGGQENGLDVYAVYRMFDALAAYALAGDSAAKPVALGNGSREQTFMGAWPDDRQVTPLTVSDDPLIERYQHKFINFWEHSLNPRVGSLGAGTLYLFRSRMAYRIRSYGVYFRGDRYYFKEGRKLKRARVQPKGPVGPIRSGFGSDGPYAMRIDSISSPLWKERSVSVFLPVGAPGRRPAVFFSHGFAMSNPMIYMPLISHLVSRGSVVIYAPYRSFAGDPLQSRKYDILYEGLCAGVEAFKDMIDTANIGFIGHSFGAGALPSIALRCIRDRGWATASAFMHLMAPWYCYEITPQELAGFPGHVKLLVQVFEDDRVNDHRMAEDLFTAIGIDPQEKDFVIVHSDTGSGYIYEADHSLPKGSWDPRGEEDALDYYTVFRLVDALAEYAATGDPAAKAVALGNGGESQRFMGVWPDDRPVKPLTVTDAPYEEPANDRYLFSWDNVLNQRRGTGTVRENGKQPQSPTVIQP